MSTGASTPWLPGEAGALTDAINAIAAKVDLPLDLAVGLLRAIDAYSADRAVKAAAAERERLLSLSPGPKCCDLHGRNCEPGELCCENCSEHDHPGHRELWPCSAPDLSPNTLDEARKIAVAVAAERERCAQLAEQVSAKYLKREDGLPILPFADLLRKDQP